MTNWDRILACPRCHYVDRFDKIELIGGSGTDTRTYLQLSCQCSEEPVLQFVVDLTPDFDRQEASPCTQTDSQL